MASIVALVSLVVVPRTAESERADRDALVVFCLSPAQRVNLIAAADALGLPTPTDLVRWPSTQPADFDRTCAAVSSAHRRPGPGFFADLLPFLTGLFGAVLAFLLAAWQNRVVRGGDLARELRGAADAFHAAVTAFGTEWEPNRPITEVVATRAVLASVIARVRSAHRDWPAVTAVTTLLAGRFAADAPAEWTAAPAELDSLRDTVFRVAVAVERPVRAIVRRPT